MATTSPTRIDDELYSFAKAAGEIMSRSAAQQIAHWARIGREVESGSLHQRDIARVLSGGGDYDALGSRDQAIVRAEWTERMTALRERLNLARDFQRAGVGYSEADAEGNVVRREPAAQPGTKSRAVASTAKKAPAKKAPAKKAPAKQAAAKVGVKQVAKKPAAKKVAAKKATDRGGKAAGRKLPRSA